MHVLQTLSDAVTLDDLLTPFARRVGRPLVSEGEVVLDGPAFAARVGAMAAQLADAGVGRGDRVALWLPNGIDYLAAIFAVARRGALTVHVNTRFGAAEVGDLLARTAARIVITRGDFAPMDFRAIFESVAPAQRATVELIIARDMYASSIAGVPVAAPWQAGVADERLGRDDDPCLTFTTGGTTARPKLVVHHQRSIAHHAAAVARRIGTDADDAALLAAVPFCGTFGLVGALAAVAGGAHVVCMDRFDADAARALVKRHAITHSLGDDRMIAGLADVGDAAAYRTMRFFAVAGFGTDATQAIARGSAAGLRPHAIYGSSEMQALFAIGDAAGAGEGAVTPVDPAARFTVSDDGELLLDGPSRFAGYFDDPATSHDGWFRSGDRATASGDGFVFEGRLGDVLRLGGFLVSPREIEAFLQAEPGVAAAQVVGVDGAGGTAPVAFVVSATGEAPQEDALIARCRAMLARYKVPRRIVAVDAFPCSTGPNGPKISRAELRRIAATLDLTDPTPSPERT